MKYAFPLLFVACAAWAPAVAGAAEDDIEKLVADVAGADKDACLCAIDDLTKRGVDACCAVPALTKALCCDDKEICWRAARALGAIGPEAKAAVPALTKALDDETPEVRAYAAFALGKIGQAAPEVIDKLISVVFDKSPLVRRAAIKALREINPPQEKVLPVVLKILEEGDPAIVMPALHTLAEEGKDAVPRLCKALQNEKACYWACLVLGEIGPDAKEAVPYLKHALKHQDPDVRLQALMTLGQIGPASAPLTPQIIAALKDDPFDGVRYAAAFALGKIGLTPEADEALRAALDHGDPFLKMVSAWALARNHPDDQQFVERAVKLIVEGLKSDDVHRRRAAAKMAVELDVPPETVAPLLVEALRDKDPKVVGNAIDALAELGPKALKNIRAALRNPELRWYAVALIRRMGPEARSAVPALIEVLRQEAQTDEEQQFRREVQFALAAVGPAARAAVPALVESLKSSDDGVRASALYALGKIGPGARAAVPVLRQKLRSENQIERLVSIMALLQIQPGERRLAAVAGPMLLKALDSEHELVRAEAAAALGRLGGSGPLAQRAIPKLKELLKDESPHVRAMAAEALEKLEAN